MNTVHLLNWHHAWLLNGDMLYCRQCGAGQPEELGDTVFQHSAHCSAQELHLQPWKHLKHIVDTDGE
ncbi:MAG: hypothetical protein EOO81_10135 [Oxalobacteraceae bacterium]|nr:MAG: hypothetical protein EOO81_10135 [Oxalobacteraceae bacterium]